jgi:hypothetical protein
MLLASLLAKNPCLNNWVPRTTNVYISKYVCLINVSGLQEAQGGIVTEGHLDDKYLLLLVKINILNSTIIKYYLTSTQSNIYRLLPS